MNQKDLDMIRKKIGEIAKEYTDNGYEVFTEPRLTAVPNFLKNYEPDIIAISEKDKVVVEVKSKSTISNSKKLEAMADVVSKQNGWRFELVLTNPIERTSEDKQELSNNEIIKLLNEASLLLQSNFHNAAFLITWSTTESVIRKKLLSEEIETTLNVLRSIKNLYSFGIVSREEYDMLSGLLKLRNTIVHGFKTTPLSSEQILDLIAWNKTMLNQI